MTLRLRIGSLAVVLVAATLGGCIPDDDRPDYGRAPQQEPPPPREIVTTRPAAPAPAWQARPVAPDARAIAATSYTVQPGDTLGAVGERTGVGSDAIARANDLTAPYVIRAGQQLEVPGGRYHLVQAGQSGIAIARAYGVPWARIVAANDLSAPYILRIGTRLVIPDASTPISPAAIADTPPPTTAAPVPATRQSALAERASHFQLDIDDIVTGGEPAIADNQRPAQPPAPTARALPATTALATPAHLAGGFGWPLHGRIVARFGPSGASGERFNGIKIATPIGSPIAAAADGFVVYAGTEIPSLGGLVIVRHGDGWITVYGHASRLLVQRGDRVRRGQVIARSGDSGFADRPELHFEMRRGRTPIDPLSQLPAA